MWYLCVGFPRHKAFTLRVVWRYFPPLPRFTDRKQPREWSQIHSVFGGIMSRIYSLIPQSPSVFILPFRTYIRDLFRPSLSRYTLRPLSLFDRLQKLPFSVAFLIQ